MVVNMITSATNSRVKRIVALGQKAKFRREEDCFLVEGSKMFLEAPKSWVKEVYISESFLAKCSFREELQSYCYEVVSDDVFQKMSDTKTPQGILSVLQCPHYEMEQLLAKANPFLIILENLQDPGNMGTIVRTAEAAGVDAVFMSKDCVDIYNPKTIRSTMGSIYRMPFLYIEDIPKLLDDFRKKSIKSYAAHLNGEKFYDQEDYKSGTAILIGNEGNGLRDEVTEKADKLVKIPMHGEVESLNAAIAASVLMFEVFRQRR